MSTLPEAGDVVLIGEDAHRVKSRTIAPNDEGLIVVLGLSPMTEEGRDGWLALVDDANDRRFIRLVHPFLDGLAQKTGRVFFWYFDPDGRLRWYFGRPGVKA